MVEGSPNGQKTHWEKEKLLSTSNFYFSHCVFKRLVLQKQGLVWERVKKGKKLGDINKVSSVEKSM